MSYVIPGRFATARAGGRGQGAGGVTVLPGLEPVNFAHILQGSPVVSAGFVIGYGLETGRSWR